MTSSLFNNVPNMPQAPSGNSGAVSGVDQQLVQLLHSNPQLANMLAQNPQLVQQIEAEPQMLAQLTSHMQQGGQVQLPPGLANLSGSANPQSIVGPDSLVAANSAHSQTAQGHSIKQVLDQAINTPEGQQIQQEMQQKFPQYYGNSTADAASQGQMTTGSRG